MKYKMVWIIKALLIIGLSTLFLIPTKVDAEKSGTITGKIKVFRARDSADVVVYIKGKNINKEYAPPLKHAVMDQKNLIFIPHVLPILKGITVDFLNSDNVKHNIFSPSKTKRFNLGTYGPEIVKPLTFDKPGEVVILCNIHSEMLAYVIILENPYFGKTDKEGNFKIENVPSGTYTLMTWHEKMSPISQDITINKGENKEVYLELKERK